MRADSQFTEQSKEFWANIRFLSQEVGYTEKGSIHVPSWGQIRGKLEAKGLSASHLLRKDGRLSAMGEIVEKYFQYRAGVLNSSAQTFLMDRNEAEEEFNKLRAGRNPSCPLPMNKQKGEKRNYAFLTGIVNMILESELDGLPCDYDPRSLLTITHSGRPLRTLSRRVDGAFPSVKDSISVWEIKEYYYTTTFGSHVADGVYETLLDGMELEELAANTGIKIEHVLVLDDRFTWWQCGKSYLCRIIDMLQMGYVDEVLFGREVLTRLPELAKDWARRYSEAQSQA